MKNLKIYFTSDLHGFVYPTDYIDTTPKNLGLLNIMNQYKKDGNTLLIDGGDTIQGSPFTNYLSTANLEVHPMATIINHAGYDYVTFGNHEFNYGYNYLTSYMNHLDAKVVSTNITDTTGGISILPYDIKQMENGLRVGVMGFSTDFINRWEREENLSNFLITDTLSSITTHMNHVKSQCDLVIGIYHGGFEYDLESHKKLSSTKENIAYQICQELDFDILLTGHQHMPIAGQYLHGTYIAQTPHNGTSYIELTLTWENGIKEITSTLQPALYDPEPIMYKQNLELELKVQQWLDTPVGSLDQALIPSTHLEMALHGSNLANFINQIQLEESNADISCTSFPNVIKGFETNVTIRDILSTYPYPNTLLVLEVNRQILKEALERSASYFTLEGSEVNISDTFLKPKVEHYNYDYFANLDYTFDLTKEIGSRVTSIRYKGMELEDSTILSLVMNNYRASGAGGYEVYQTCSHLKESVTEMPELIINYFKTYQQIKVDQSSYITVHK